MNRGKFKGRVQFSLHRLHDEARYRSRLSRETSFGVIRLEISCWILIIAASRMYDIRSNVQRHNLCKNFFNGAVVSRMVEGENGTESVNRKTQNNFRWHISLGWISLPGRFLLCSRFGASRKCGPDR